MLMLLLKRCSECHGRSSLHQLRYMWQCKIFNCKAHLWMCVQSICTIASGKNAGSPFTSRVSRVKFLVIQLQLRKLACELWNINNAVFLVQKAVHFCQSIDLIISHVNLFVRRKSLNKVFVHKWQMRYSRLTPVQSFSLALSLYSAGERWFFLVN